MEENNKKCKHHWIFMESICKRIPSDHYIEYTRTDLFFCEKCLEQKQIKKSSNQLYNTPKPDWYKE